MQVHAEAAGKTDGADHPDGGASGDTAYFAATVNDGAGPEKSDALDDALDDARRIDGAKALVMAEKVDQLEGHQAKRARTEGHQNIGAQTEWFVP